MAELSSAAVGDLGAVGVGFGGSEVADQAVAAGITARVGDPAPRGPGRRKSAQVRDQRADIEGQIARWEATADELVAKTATWGAARVDTAMAPRNARHRPAAHRTRRPRRARDHHRVILTHSPILAAKQSAGFDLATRAPHR